MPGVGINLDNFLEIKKVLEPKYIYLSAKETLQSSMIYRNKIYLWVKVQLINLVCLEVTVKPPTHTTSLKTMR